MRKQGELIIGAEIGVPILQDGIGDVKKMAQVILEELNAKDDRSVDGKDDRSVDGKDDRSVDGKDDCSTDGEDDRSTDGEDDRSAHGKDDYNAHGDVRKAPFNNAKSLIGNPVDDAHNYDQWYIGSDVSISKGSLAEEPTHNIVLKQPKSAYDIISDVTYSNRRTKRTRPIHRDWKAEIRKLFDALHVRLAINPISYLHCSTQVHVSFKSQDRIPLREAQLVSIAAIYFENAINALMPRPWRHFGMHGKHYTRPNMHNYRVKSEEGGWKINMHEAWRLIRAKTSVQDLAKLVCNPADSKDVPGDEYWSSGERKFFKWNINGLQGNKTIEFRQIPPSMSADDVIDWIDFTAAFVKASIAVLPEALDSAAWNKKYPGAFHSAFGMSGLKLKDRPPEDVRFLQHFLAESSLNGPFWVRRERYRHSMNNELEIMAKKYQYQGGKGGRNERKEEIKKEVICCADGLVKAESDLQRALDLFVIDRKFQPTSKPI